MKIKPPLNWFGGKYYMLTHLLPRIPDHHSYVEIFGGGAQLLLAKPISPLEIYNDLDSHLVEFFRTIQNDEEREILIDRWKNTLYSRALFYEYKNSWADQTDRLERVYQWFVVARQSFAGRFSSAWGYCVNSRSPAGTYKGVIDSMEAVGNRIRDWQIDNKSWTEMLDIYDHADAFFYLDPPYVHTTRKNSMNVYRHEMSDEDHKQLIKRIQTLDAKVMLSGYSNRIYDELPWQRTDVKTLAYAAGRTRHSNLKGEGSATEHQQRTESIWCNYEPPQQLNLFSI